MQSRVKIVVEPKEGEGRKAVAFLTEAGLSFHCSLPSEVLRLKGSLPLRGGGEWGTMLTDTTGSAQLSIAVVPLLTSVTSQP